MPTITPEKRLFLKERELGALLEITQAITQDSNEEGRPELPGPGRAAPGPKLGPDGEGRLRPARHPRRALADFSAGRGHQLAGFKL